MTAPLYLGAIRLSNFRSFGLDAHVPLTPGPGITVVVGANGLGKTSLIEAVEWALTGSVRRLAASVTQGKKEAIREAVETALTRHEQAPRSHSVTLEFSDGPPVRRGADHVPDQNVIATWLKAPAWRHEVRDLSSYLAMTHILSQSAAMRLTARSGAERWEALRQPVGLERIDRVLDNLGMGSKKRLTGRIDAIAKDVRQATERVDQFRTLRARVAERAAATAGHEVLPPNRIVEATVVCLTELAALTGTRTDTTPAPTPTEALSRLHEGLLQAARILERQTLDVGAAQRALDAFSANDAQLRESATALEAATATVEAVATALRSAEERALVANRRLDALRGDLAARISLRDRLYAQRQGRQDLRNVEEECRRWQAHAEEIAASLAVARQEEEPLRAALVMAMDARGALANLERERDELRQLAEAERRWRDGRPALDVDRAALRALAPQHTREKERIATLTAACEEVERQCRTAQDVAQRLTADVEERARLVAELALHLHPDDRECPVCKTIFDPGDLIKRARRLVADGDPRVQAATADVAALSDKAAALVDALRVAEDSLAALDRQGRDLSNRIAEREEAEAWLRHHSLSSGRPVEELAGWLSSRLDAVAAAMAGHDARWRDLDGDGTLSQRLTTLAATIVRLSERRDAVLQDSEAVVRHRDSLRGRLDADGDLSGLDEDGIEAAVAEAQTGIATVEGAIVGADREAADDWRDLQQAQTAREAAECALENARERSEALGRTQQIILRQWHATGLTGHPSREGMAALEDRIAASEQTVRALQHRHSDLSEHHRHWLDDKSLREEQAVVQSMVTEEQAESEDACERRLLERTEQLERMQTAWETTRSLVDTLEKRIQARHASFGQQAIAPLQRRVEAFDLAWSAFPELQLQLSVNRSRGVRTLGATIHDQEAAMILSEGQAGVKSLSYLLSASTAYPWCRWRSLLLDDPLQYNDLVHKTAFLDVLRTLIAERGYQVVMSTHDLEEARFIGRKCRNANIPIRVCRLLSPGENGVQFQMS